MIIKTKNFKKPMFTLKVRINEKHLWKYFHPHHYMTVNKELSKSFPNGAKFYTFYWVKDTKEILVGCLGVLFQIASGQKAKRLTRIVVLPEYQGLGFSSKMINAISEYYSSKGFKIYCSSFHPRLGSYWKKSKNWIPGMYNMVEFKKTDIHVEKSMSGLRDGVKMYRYFYKPTKPYTLLLDVIRFNELEKQVKELQDKVRDNDEEDKYKNLLREINALKENHYKYTNKKYLLKDEENIAYIPTNKRIKKPKLTSLERKTLRLKRKQEKINEW